MLCLELIFWICILAVMHSYIFYPQLLKILAAGKKANSHVYQRTDDLPNVTILIPAYNEETVIGEKLESIFNSDYSTEKIEVFVGSDSSTDKTNEIVKSFQSRFSNLQLVEFPGRIGKASIVNQLVTISKNEILILTDANIIFSSETIYELLKHFCNREIVLVDTHMKHKSMRKEGISFQEQMYIQTEVEIKRNEGLIWGTMMGPFGGCFALRKDFYTNVPPSFLVDDFFITLKALEKGGKSINEYNAIVYEDISNDLWEEFKRKIRIATGNWQNLFTFFHLLFRFNGLSFSFFSHKVLRWLTPLFLITAFILSFPLTKVNDIYYWILFFELGIVALPLLDSILKTSNIHIFIFRLATHFFAMNLALLIGLFCFIKGVKSGIWNPTRRNQ